MHAHAYDHLTVKRSTSTTVLFPITYTETIECYSINIIVQNAIRGVPWENPCTPLCTCNLMNYIVVQQAQN